MLGKRNITRLLYLGSVQHFLVLSAHVKIEISIAKHSDHFGFVDKYMIYYGLIVSIYCWYVWLTVGFIRWSKVPAQMDTFAWIPET
jgi:hypothetical protein